MGWLVPIGIWLVIALSFFWAGREAQRLRDPARHRRPGPTPARSLRPGERLAPQRRQLDGIDIHWTEVPTRPGRGRPRPASWDLSIEPPAGAERPSVSTRRRYSWEDHTTSDRGQFN